MRTQHIATGTEISPPPMVVCRGQQRTAGQLQRQEGVAMLIVLLVLLVTTAAATYSLHSVSFDLRSAGYAKQAMQTEYVAATAINAAFAYVDRIGPTSLLSAMNGSNPPAPGPNEPALAPGKQAYRVDLRDFADAPPVVHDSLGAKQPYDPFFQVDFNDIYTYVGVIAGQRVDGGGRLQFLRATYTARGRTQLLGETARGTDPRPDHEGAVDMRAEAVSGPFGR